MRGLSCRGHEIFIVTDNPLISNPFIGGNISLLRMIYGAHPKNLLENPAADLIKSIPSIWDETITLPVSEIGEIAAFARRRGDIWFVGIMNSDTEKSIRMPLSFLAKEKYQAMLVRDQKDDPAAVKIENLSISNRDNLSIALRAGGGFVGRFRR